MKILVIRIRNLASLEGTTEINFKQEPLCSAGIFAITGPTGAGKSTILDALCLALYGKTPRFRLAETGVEVKDVKGSTINQSDVRGILRDGAADGFAEVEFAGIDGSNYRATWSVRRARNRADGNLQSYEVALHNISSNVVVPGRKTELLDEIERLVGLNFDQFTRSVLLPQGDFTAFLKAGRDEKSSLLEKLTGTQVYSEISKRVFEKHRLNLQRLHELNMQKEGVSTLTKEEIEALLQRKDDLADLIIVAENKLTEIGKEIAWHEQLSDMQKNIDAASEKVEHAAAIKTASRPRVQKLQLISRVQSIKPEVDSLRSAQNNLQHKNELIGKLNDDLNQLLKQIATLEVNIRLAEKSLESNIQNNEEAQPVLDDAKSLDVRLVEISKQVGFADSEEKTAVEKYNQYRLQVEKKENEARSLDDKIRDLSKWRSANINRKPVADNESLILSKLQDGQNLLANSEANNIVIDSMTLAIGASQKLITAVGQEISSLGLSIAELTETYKRNDGLLSAIPINDVKAEENIIGMRVQDIIAADAHWKVLNAAIAEHEMLLRSLKDNRHEADSNAAQLTIVDKLQETAKIQRDTALSMLDKARLAIAENVEQLRDALVPGDPCVVCGSTSHPYAGHNPRLHQFLTELESSYKEVDKNYNDQLKTQIGLQRSIEQLRKTITTQVADLEKREKAMVGQKEQWMQFNFLFQSGDIAVHDRGEWLQNQLKSEKEKLKWLRDRIKDYEEGKANLELQKKQLDALGKKLDHQVNLAKDEERKTMSLKEQLSAKKEETQKLKKTCSHPSQTSTRKFNVL
ncbi:MAG: hypothetical protein EOO01_01870 [Chitinophagaceae bacterium]|nr:MAG: hypothetical protein EOO01_01870 [Chitinophagaceae bacterium]